MSNLFVFITISHFKNATCSFFVRVTVLSFAVFLPSASFSCRRGASRVICLTLLVMCSHYPWDSSGFLACLSSLYLPLLSLPHSFLKINSAYPHTSLPSSLLLQPALEIHCGIDRKTSPVSLWMLGAMYITDQRFLLSPSPNWLKMQRLSRRACISKSNVYKADNLSHFSPLPVLQARVSQIRHLSVTEYICLQTRRHVNELANNCEKRG